MHKRKYLETVTAHARGNEFLKSVEAIKQRLGKQLSKISEDQNKKIGKNSLNIRLLVSTLLAKLWTAERFKFLPEDVIKISSETRRSVGEVPNPGIKELKSLFNIFSQIGEIRE